MKAFLFCTIATLLLIGCKKDSVSSQDNHSCSQFTDDRDGETYSVVNIGNQCWMAENLRYNASGSWLNPNNPDTKYGVLYDWATVMDNAPSSSSNPSTVQGICPNGWHVPSDEEWTELTNSITNDVELRSTTGWGNANNESNKSAFNAFPAGYCLSGDFYALGGFAGFWSSTTGNSTNSAWYRNIANGSGVVRNSYGKDFSFSCRCVKD